VCSREWEGVGGGGFWWVSLLHYPPPWLIADAEVARSRTKWNEVGGRRFRRQGICRRRREREREGERERESTKVDWCRPR
jgi:hypothetical protein